MSKMGPQMMIMNPNATATRRGYPFPASGDVVLGPAEAERDDAWLQSVTPTDGILICWRVDAQVDVSAGSENAMTAGHPIESDISTYMVRVEEWARRFRERRRNVSDQERAVVASDDYWIMLEAIGD